MTDVALSLVSHTNVGKTTLARTLLGRDIGQVRDEPHVTEFADRHELIESTDPPPGDRLLLWDTPGFGDSVRLVRRLRSAANPLARLLNGLWDRWRDRPFWASQQALRHVRAESDVLLYLVNASEPEAGWLDSEMELLDWVGKPVLVLLNQLGAPREAALEAAELAQWRHRLARWPQVREVLPLDAFARCWVHERSLLLAVQRVLDGEHAQAMQRLSAAWAAQREAQFEQAMQALAQSLARIATTREVLDGMVGGLGLGLGQRLRQAGARLLGSDSDSDSDDPAAAAQQRLALALEAEVRASTARLVELHGLDAAAGTGTGPGPGPVLEQILARVAGQFEQHRRVSEGRAAVLGGALSGALAGLKADIVSGGLTLGGGLLAGGILGALGAAGLARGINLMRGTDRNWVAWGDEALPAITEAALLRYLAVAHFGRGRGGYVQGEAPPHWPAAVRAALEPQSDALRALWQGRSDRFENAGQAGPLAAALQPLLVAATRTTLAGLYPADNPPP